jgi:RNA polymerase-interacting CarD/CdnL/TRCF family regulator
MSEQTVPYAKGDWIVHRHHGVGQIKGSKKMQLGGEENTYCQIDTSDSTLWMPFEKVNDEWVRPLASADEMERALAALERRPRVVEADVNKRKKQISAVKPFHSPLVIAKLLRDLTAFNRKKKQVSQSDRDAVRYLTRLLASEYSVCMDLDVEKVREQLQAALSHG